MLPINYRTRKARCTGNLLNHRPSLLILSARYVLNLWNGDENLMILAWDKVPLEWNKVKTRMQEPSDLRTYRLKFGI